MNEERLSFQAKTDSLTTLNEQLNIENVALVTERDQLNETVNTVRNEKAKVDDENTKPNLPWTKLKFNNDQYQSYTYQER